MASKLMLSAVIALLFSEYLCFEGELTNYDSSSESKVPDFSFFLQISFIPLGPKGKDGRQFLAGGIVRRNNEPDI